jgi:hypothetical protein
MAIPEPELPSRWLDRLNKPLVRGRPPGQFHPQQQEEPDLLIV